MVLSAWVVMAAPRARAAIALKVKHNLVNFLIKNPPVILPLNNSVIFDALLS